MDWIKILTYATHLFSYSFNIILLYVVAKNSKVIKTKGYITHMIWVELVLNFCQHFSVEYVLEAEDESSLHFLESVCVLFMTLQMWTVNTIRYIMTFLMAANRFVCIINPRFSKFFDSETVTFFGVGIWILAFIGSWYLLLLGCFPRFDSETFVLDTECNYLIWPDFVYKSHYLLILTLILNVMIVVYAKLRRSGVFKVVIARVSVIAANRRSRHETMFIIQSLIVFIFMAYDAVYTSLRKIYEPQFNQLPNNFQIFLGWLNIFSANYINFLIYFLFHKSNRLLVLRTIFCDPKWLKNIKVRPS
ncbi:G_PROTEIN_RECEP_F1_2 domain-containing protein [Caenorhabditis elegans]|uniref:G_PROTEIN_RECEP_F1_2 domain-containing protein n=1 Tax=Caenorhabditis elegans TaxID=6239 RepID=Q5FC58_CAEEL|nr:G_PROTEIN_RECEP_F1_2 domain-containing protein [Caenorhabditis elegans]CAI46558.2 G_PROTEIN_RECEP_F1_2 domain-containing protein [Caenorhabditis elegans]|eukprot:NP_001023632.1 Serpentine Receptor, class XA [Caenorhabditis elegans]